MLPANCQSLVQQICRDLSIARKLLSTGLFSAGLVFISVGSLPSEAAGEEKAATVYKPAVECSTNNTDLYGDPLPAGAVARMGSIQLRHAEQSDLVILPDSKTILTAGGQVVRFWDVSSARLVRQVKLQGPFAPGRSATPSPDGKILAGLDRNKLVLWELESGKQLKTLPGPDGMWAYMYFTPDSKTLFIGTWKQEVIVWDWHKGTERRIALLPRNIGLGSDFHGHVSPDGKLLSAGSAGRGELLGVYELATGRVLHHLTCHPTASVFSPDSRRLIVASSTNDKKGREAVIRVFDVATGQEVAQFALGHQSVYGSLAASPDGKTIACGFSDRSCLLDLRTGRVLHSLQDGPIQVAFSPDGKRLIASMGHRLRIWDPATGKVLHDRAGDFGSTPVLTTSPDGRVLAAADWMDLAVSLWDTASGRLLSQLPQKGETRYVHSLAFSRNGKTLIACQHNGFLQFWDVASGKEQRTVQLLDPNRKNSDHTYFFQLHASLDSKHVSSLEQFFAEGESTRLAYWDLDTARIVSQHFLPPQARKCAWLADGMRVALPLKNGLTQMNVENGSVRYQIPGTQIGGPLATSPDDRLLAAMTTGEAQEKAAIGIWEAVSGKEVTTVATDPVSHLALLPDTRHLIAADGSFLRLWDLKTGKEKRRWAFPEANTCIGSNSVVTQLLLSPDGRRALTALNDGTVLVWDLQSALRRELLAARPSDKELVSWWNDLAEEDARRAYTAIWRLSETPESTIPFLGQHLKPATESDLKAIRRLIADLDSDEYVTREKATEQLVKIGFVAEAALRHTLEQNPPVEARRRMQLLLDKIDQQPPTGESLRLLRALHVLEHSGTAGLRLLRKLANGAEGASITNMARTALKRIDPSLSK